MLLLQEFVFEVKNRKGTNNQVANHLPRLQDNDIREVAKTSKIDDAFPEEVHA